MIKEAAPPEDNNGNGEDDEPVDQEPGHRYELAKANNEENEKDNAGNDNDDFDDRDVEIPAEIQGAEMQGAEQVANIQGADQPFEDKAGDNNKVDQPGNNKAGDKNRTEYLVKTVQDEAEEDQGADADPGKQEATDATTNVAPPRYNLRSNCDQTLEHRFAHAIDNPESQQSYGLTFVQAIEEFQHGDKRATHRTLCHVILNQMTAQAGIKKHGQAAVDALFKEFAQLNEKQVFGVLDMMKLS